MVCDSNFQVRPAATEVYRALRDVSDVSDHALRADPGDQALARQRQVHRPAERKSQTDRPDRIFVQDQYPSAEAGAHGQVDPGPDSGGCPLGLFRNASSELFVPSAKRPRSGPGTKTAPRVRLVKIIRNNQSKYLGDATFDIFRIRVIISDYVNGGIFTDKIRT